VAGGHISEVGKPFDGEKAAASLEACRECLNQ
jgi:hypothetical protein